MKAGLYASVVGLFLVYCSVSAGLPPDRTLEESTTQSCMIDADCTSGSICVDQNCEDPCLGVCGPNTDCHVLNNSPVCTCKPGHKGKPLLGCTFTNKLECTSNNNCSADKACLNNICVDPCREACGSNTECDVINHKAVCACVDGFSWVDSKGCHPNNVPECNTNVHCPSDRACLSQKCVNPCDGVCGNNTVCQVSNHYPACACSPGYSGDPFTECKPLCLVQKPQPESNVAEKKTFLLGPDMRSWGEARIYCVKKNMRLVSINNDEEFVQLKNYISNGGVSGDIWTGGYCFEANHCSWVPTNEPITYPDFDPVTPQSTPAADVCIDLRPTLDYRLGYYSCNYAQRFICES